jgi:GNAT superfamily N-acetyltransferase
VKFKISQATPSDSEILVQHRLGMFRDMFPELENKIQHSEEQTREWIQEKLADGTLVGFIVRTNTGQAAGSGCLWIRKDQPNPTRPRLEAPYLMSMYTEKEFRRRGIAKLIVQNVIVWSRENRYDRITLHATDVGKPLYLELGFKLTNEMKLNLSV